MRAVGRRAQIALPHAPSGDSYQKNHEMRALQAVGPIFVEENPARPKVKFEGVHGRRLASRRSRATPREAAVRAASQRVLAAELEEARATGEQRRIRRGSGSIRGKRSLNVGLRHSALE